MKVKLSLLQQVVHTVASKLSKVQWIFWRVEGDESWSCCLRCLGWTSAESCRSCVYTGCPGGNVPDFGRMFLTLKYTDPTPKHLYPKLNGYGDNGERKAWSSCGSTYCTCFTYCYSYTAHVRPSVSQPSQAHSGFIINRCYSYSEL